MRRVSKPPFFSARARAWRVMRNFGERREAFTIDDLLQRIQEEFGAVDCDRSNLHRYLKRLNDAGYLRMVSGSRGVMKRYRLIRDTGPKHPVLRENRLVFDPNTDEVFGEVA